MSELALGTSHAGTVALTQEQLSIHKMLGVAASLKPNIFGREKLMQQSLFVWLRSASWNAATLAAQSVGLVATTLTLKGSQRMGSYTHFEKTGAVNISTSSAGNATYSYSVTDQVSVFAIKLEIAQTPYGRSGQKTSLDRPAKG